jgi:DNA primase
VSHKWSIMTDDIVEQVKAVNRIEDIIGAEFTLEMKRGRYRKAQEHDSLVVDTANQVYFWNSLQESGDVIAWLMKRKGYDFKTAVEELCKRAGIALPDWGRADMHTRISARVREDAWEVACQCFERWLWADADALAYARSRGWSDETIKAARLGYTGRSDQRAAMAKDLRGKLGLGSVDVESPAAVAMIGYNGDVSAWGRRQSVNVRDDWSAAGYVPGFVGRDMLVYPHMQYGRVKYFSGRGVHEKRHYNLPVELAGPRQVYFNATWAAGEPACVVVEGQADAVTLSQWGMAAVALAGTNSDNEYLRHVLKDHQALYVGLDNDQAGALAEWKLARSMGPMVRVLAWASNVQNWTDGAGAEHPVKDANDLLRSMGGAALEEQYAALNELISGSLTFAETVAAWAGKQEGAAQDAAIRQALGVISQLSELDLAHYRNRLTKALGVNVRELSNMLKKFKETATDAEKADQGEPVFTWGGYTDGWLIEYLYDAEAHESTLAWRDPEGKVGSGKYVEINERRYLPYPPNEALRSGAVLFPSRLGDRKSIRELVAYVELYLKSVYLLPSDKMARLVSYYVMLTWLYDAFETIIYLRALGSAGSGKSEFMRRVGLVCYRTMTANGAGSTSSLFRALERYRGTVFIDEADIQNSDTENDMVKFYNLGAMRNNPIWRTVEVTGPNGAKDWESVSFQTFCPKLVAMRKEFRDDAVGSRSLTFKFQPRETVELVTAGVSLSINSQMREKAEALRNLLVRWRLENWQPEIEVQSNFYDLTISARLNQVAGPLLALAADDPEQQEEIRHNLREYYAETILSKSMTITARVIEALWKIWRYPDLHQMMVKEDGGEHLIKIGDITRIANEIIDEMNDEGDDDGDDSGSKKNKPNALKHRKVGWILREELQLQVTERRRDGFWVYWNEPRMVGLSTRFGVDPDEIVSKAVEEAGIAAREAQGKLV